MDSDEEGVPQHILDKIDRVFDTVTRPRLARHQPTASDEVVAPVTVRRRRGDVAVVTMGQSQGGGGFLPPSPPPTAGGFIVDDDDSGEPQQNAGVGGAATHIPLAMIPSALQMLDLPPADDEVLEVFRNAAGGWDGSIDGQEGVSRKDWKSVCLILLSQQEQPRASSGDDLMQDESPPQEESSVEGSDDEEYRETEQNGWLDDEQSDDGEDDDAYNQPSKRSADRKGKGKAQPVTRTSRGKKRRRDSFEDDEGVPKSMTRRQKAACREAFALFFPDVEDKDLDAQRIMIKDIVRVAGLVKERMTAEEVVEMLSEFSTSPDKSVSLPDFERMMMVAKLA